MIPKKDALFWGAIAAVSLAIIAALFTWNIAQGAITGGDAYILSKDQYADYQQYRKISEIEDIIKDRYYEEPDVDALYEGALEGVVAALNDPYSEYINEQEQKRFDQLNSGGFTGIGVTITVDAETGYPLVLDVSPGSPAEAGGIKQGDSIIAADGQDFYGFDLDRVVALIMGDKGTKVVVTIERAGEKQDIELTRSEIKEVTISHKLFENSVGYVKISKFGGNTTDDFIAAMRDLEQRGAAGIVIDLRNNGGGLLHEAVKICDFLMPSGVITYTKGRTEDEHVYESDADAFNLPVVVLVNGNSASASEIMAGALKVSGTAQIVGSQTFGKGIVQTYFELSDKKTSVKLTTSVYYLADDTTPHEVGVEPHHIVESEGNAIPDDTSTDNQLQKAIEVLRTQTG
ncbi:MAG: S41 family peptidase [Christensenellales bacterium]|jgi:carboxyl-terminal processing protease